MSHVQIFVSYSHDDARWFDVDRLMPRLIKSLEIVGADVWFDHRRLGGGDPWKQEIVDAIKRAHIAVILVSRNFLNSDFIRDIEIPRIERRFEQGELIVVPILVGHCNWQSVRMLTRLQMIPGKPTPLIGYLDSPSEWDRVQEEIFTAIERQVERIRVQLNLPMPSRREPVNDPSATITRLSGIGDFIPPTQKIEPEPLFQQKHEAIAKPGPPAVRPEAKRHTWIVPVAAAASAAVVTAGILWLGPLGNASKATVPDPAQGIQSTSVTTPSMQPAIHNNRQGNVAPAMTPTQQVPPAGQLPTQGDNSTQLPVQQGTAQTPPNPAMAQSTTTPIQPHVAPASTSPQPMPATTPAPVSVQPEKQVTPPKPKSVTQQRQTQPTANPKPAPESPPPAQRPPSADELKKQAVDALTGELQRRLLK